MIKNYFKIAWRALLRHPGYSSIKIIGLGLGICCCLLIGLFVHKEFTFDRFPEQSDNIVRVVLDVDVADGVYSTARTAPPMGPALQDEFPEIINSFRLRKAGSTLVAHEEQSFYERNFYFADPAVFDVLSLSLNAGNPKTVLQKPFSLVITASAARKYFGEENPVGKTLLFDLKHTLTISGVVEDFPLRSHFHPDFVASFSSLRSLYGDRLDNWGWTGVNTYLLLRDRKNASALQSKLQGFLNRHVQQDWAQTWHLLLQPVTDIHLHSHRSGELEANSDIRTPYFLIAVGFFVLLIASINFINLTTAQMISRKREIGIRKVLGAYRRQLAQQLLGEAILIGFLSTVLAFFLAELSLPFLSSLTGGESVLIVPLNGMFALLLIGLGILLGLSVGLYPAFVSSRAKPVTLLKGKERSGISSIPIRQALVILQFTISIMLIIGTFTVIRQLDYMKNSDLGFNEKQVIVLPMQDSATSQHFAFIKNALLANPDISSATVASHIPGEGYDQIVHVPEGISREDAPSVPILFVDEDFIDTLGIELVQGRNFSGINETNAFIVNEAAAKRFGWDQSLGKQISDGNGDPIGPVIGVMKDFHFESFHDAIDPLILRIQPSWFEKVAVRINQENIPRTLDFLKQQWKEFEPAYPFQYSFLDEDFAHFYQSDRTLGKTFGYAAALAILIACLGLFGLVAYAAETRVKEIGIRKVLGASVADIVTLLSKDFVKLVLIGFFLAVPVAWYAMNRWLADFAYRIDIGVGIFVAAGGAALSIALLTVSWKSIRAALANPADSLRNE